jgi:hypothetical protein
MNHEEYTTGDERNRPAVIEFAEEDDADSSLGDNDRDDDSTHRMPDPFRVANDIVRRVRENDPDFVHLELEDGYMTEWLQCADMHVTSLTEALQTNTTILHVSVSGEFFVRLAESRHLEQPNPQYYDRLFFDCIGRLSQMKTLEISEVIDFDGYSLGMDILHDLLHNAAQLERLTLRFVELTRPAAQTEEDNLDNSLANIGAADENNVSNRMLFQAFHNHPSLKEVSFAQLRLEEGIALNPLIRGLATIPNLRTVQLHMSVQRQEERGHMRVQENDQPRGYTEATLKPIGLSPTLEALELSSLGMRDEQSMLQALHSNINLKDLFLGNCELSFSGWATLAHMIQRKTCEDCVALESLRLDSMTGLDDSTVQLLCHALASKPHTSPTLQRLLLYNIMDLGGRGWKAISEMIASNQSLRILSFENCQGMDDDAIVGMAEALEHNTTLKTLELQVFAGHCTRFSQKVGQEALLEMLRSGKNITLETLYTQASEKYVAPIEFYLKLNRSGLRQYVLEKKNREGSTPESLAVDFWALLEPFMDDLDVIFHLMTTNPPFVMSCLRSL